jgi:Ca2+-binding EF-hand superfamily protein
MRKAVDGKLVNDEVVTSSDSTVDDVEVNNAVDMNGEDEFRNGPRGKLARIVTGRVWSVIFLWLIFANTVSMAMYDPVNPDSAHNAQLEQIELIFLIIFTVEIALKLLALDKEFFSDGWNTLDFVIVGSAYMQFLPGMETVNTSVFRTIRVLRPLRSIGMMPGVRVLIDALIMSLPGLSSVFVLIFFAYTVFSVMGVQLFRGSFLYHCVPSKHCIPGPGANLTGTNLAGTNMTVSYLRYGSCYTTDDCWSDSFGCYTTANASICPMLCVDAPVPSPVPYSAAFAGEFGFCKLDDPDHACGAGLACMRSGAGAESLHHGATSWDNLPSAVLILFQMTTTEGWTSIMKPTLQQNEPALVYGFFIGLLLFTSFFLMNFMLAQMVIAFSRAVAVKQSMRPPDISTVDLLVRKLNIICNKAGAAALGTDVWSMREIFNKFDSDGSGYLNGEEIDGLAAKLNMKLSIEEMDVDGDGTISYPEFETWWRMRREYDTYDKDGSGSLNVDEVKIIAKRLKVSIDFAEMDIDGDGKVSYLEFVSWWNMSRLYKELDTTLDGRLDVDELTALSTRLKFNSVDVIIRSIQTEDDGCVEFPEFQVWWQMYRAFAAMDEDGSGELDANEIQKVGELLNMKLDVTAMTNGEVAEGGAVSFEQFASWWADAGKEQKQTLAKEGRTLATDVPAGLRGLVMSNIFNQIVLAVVILNFAVLAMDHHNIDPDLSDAIEAANLVFTGFFTIEMLLKLGGLQLDYFRDQMNLLDAAVVVSSLVEIFMGSDGAMSSMRAVRLVRVMRSMRLFSQIESMRRLLEATAKSGAAIFNFGVLLFFFLVIYALIGLHAFGGDFGSPVYTAPGRFDDFRYAFYTVFQILTRENWHELLYVGFHSQGWFAFLYLATLIVITNYMILSLFLGNLLHNLQLVFLAEAQAVARKASAARAKARKVKAASAHAKREKRIVTGAVAFQGKTEVADHKGIGFSLKERNAALTIQRHWLAFQSSETRKLGEPPIKKTCFVLTADHPFRKSCTGFVNHPSFEVVILLAIAVSSLTLAVEHPGDNSDSTKAMTLRAIDVLLTSVFIVEMAMKIISTGFVGAKSSYIRDGWNCMDFVVIIASVIGLLPFGQRFKPLRVVRTFRVVRPLRAMTRLPGLKTITEAIYKSLAPICIVGGISIFLCTIFAVAFVALQKGKLYHCDLDDSLDCPRGRAGCEDAPQYFTYAQCDAEGGSFVQDTQNFDNIFAALLTLFELMTLEDWQGTMYSSIDTTDISTEVSTGMSRNTFERSYRGSPNMGLLYMLFILVGSFFLLNLFLGVVASAFDVKANRAKTQALKQAAKAKRRERMLEAVSPILATGSWYKSARTPCINLVAKRPLATYWDIVVAAAIILNVVIMATEHAEPSDAFETTLHLFNIFFTCFFTFEVIVKLIALNPKRFFADNWNCFDTFIVTISLLELILELLKTSLPIKPSVFRAFRVLRLTRLLKLVPHSKGLQLIFQTVLEALPLMGNVGILLMVVFFVYTVLAVQFFGLVEPPPQDNGGMNELLNFKSFPRAWWTLFVASTGEHWNAFMHELMESEDGPGTALTTIFFLTFQFFCVFLTLNLFIGVVVACVQEAEEGEFAQRQSGVTVPDDLEWEDLDRFIYGWATIDPSCAVNVSDSVAREVLKKLYGSPLLPKIKDERGVLLSSAQTVDAILPILGIKAYSDDKEQVNFGVLLTKLINNTYGSSLKEQATTPHPNAKVAGAKNKILNPMAEQDGAARPKFVNPMHGDDAEDGDDGDEPDG